MTFQVTKKKGFDLRELHLGKSKRVVVKVGSAVLTDENGLNQKVMANLAKEVSFLVNSGKEVILVSSGAVAAGKKDWACRLTETLSSRKSRVLQQLAKAVSCAPMKISLIVLDTRLPKYSSHMMTFQIEIAI
jgi:glutamate 5-kinase